MKIKHGTKTDDAVEKKTFQWHRKKDRMDWGKNYKIWGICRVIPAHMSE